MSQFNANSISCWNTIGVWGSQAPRCEKLSDVIHCRNCKVYWNAGREVLNRNIPAGYLDHWTEALAGVPDLESNATNSIIYFRLYKEWFSLSTINFVEVSQVRQIHNIPHQSSELILGVVNISGAVRLCFSLSHLLGVAGAGETDGKRRGVYQRYLVTKINGNEYVFPVDEVGGVFRYDSADLKQVPVTVEPEMEELLLGVLEVGDVDVACINAEKLAQTFEGMIDG